MLDKRDTFTRWYQGIVGVIALLISALVIACEIPHLLHPSISSYSNRYRDMAAILGLGGLYLSFRCLWYAITGTGNINRDDL